MYKERILKPASIVWLSLVLAVSGVYEYKKIPRLEITGFPGVDTLISAVRDGRTLSKEDLYDASVMDYGFLGNKFGKDARYSAIELIDNANNAILFQNPVGNLDGGFPVGKDIDVVVGAGIKFYGLRLNYEENKAVEKLANKKISSDVDCFSDLRIELRSEFQNGDIFRDIFFFRGSEYLGSFMIVSVVDFKSGNIVHYINESKETIGELSNEALEVIKACG